MSKQNGQRPPLCGLTEDQVDALQAPLDPANIKTRKQGRTELGYIEGHHAIREANRIFGPTGWTRDSHDMRCVHEGEYQGDGKTGWIVCYVCRVTVRVRSGDDYSVATDGWGYGESIGYGNLGQCHEGAVKEAETDAMKRALIKFGDPLGLALYDKERENVAPPPPPMPPGLDENGIPQNLTGLSNALKLDGVPLSYCAKAAQSIDLDWESRTEFAPQDLQRIRVRAGEMHEADKLEAQEAATA